MAASSSVVPGRLFVGELAFATTENMLREHFNKYGEIAYVVFKRKRFMGNGRDFAFVQFIDPSTPDKALEENLHIINGKEVTVKKATPPEDRHRPRPIRKIYVGDLPSLLTVEDFTNYFKVFGEVENAVIINDPKTNKPKGYGFVTFENEESAKRAMKKEGGHHLDGKLVEVKEAKDRYRNSSNSTTSVPPTFFNQLMHPAPHYNGQIAARFEAYVPPAPLPGHNIAYQARNLQQVCLPPAPLPLHMMNQASDLRQGYVPPPPLPQHLQQALRDMHQPREFEQVPGHNFLVRIDGCLWNLNSLIDAADSYAMSTQLNSVLNILDS